MRLHPIVILAVAILALTIAAVIAQPSAEASGSHLMPVNGSVGEVAGVS